MNLLRAIESRIASLVEGTFGRVFRTNVQPVEIARRLVKEMDDNRRQAVRNVYVPNIYDVYLSRDDFRQFRDLQAALSTELAEYLAEHARRNGYALASRPRVTLHMDRDLEVGSFGIATKIDQDAAAAAASTPPDAAAPSHTIVAPAVVVDSEPELPQGANLGDFRLVGPDGTLTLERERTSIGRGRSNDLVVHDSSVSREHAEVLLANGGFVVRDLDSTNGVRVNGSRVREHPLAPGDVLLLGNAELRFEPQPHGAGS